MVATASTEHFYWLALAFVAWKLSLRFLWFSFTQRTQPSVCVWMETGLNSTAPTAASLHVHRRVTFASGDIIGARSIRSQSKRLKLVSIVPAFLVALKVVYFYLLHFTEALWPRYLEGYDHWPHYSEPPLHAPQYITCTSNRWSKIFYRGRSIYAVRTCGAEIK